MMETPTTNKMHISPSFFYPFILSTFIATHSSLELTNLPVNTPHDIPAPLLTQTEHPLDNTTS